MVRYDTLTNGDCHMTAADFRRIALGLEGVEEYPHAGLVESDFSAERARASDARRLRQ